MRSCLIASDACRSQGYGRQPRGEAGLSLRRIAGGEHRRRPLHRRCVAAWRRRDPRARRRKASSRFRRHHRGQRPAPASCADCRPLLRRSTGSGRRRDRHKRQDVGCLFRAPALVGRGLKAASLGTVGLVSLSGIKTLAHTTPDPIELHRILAALAKEGVTILRSKHRATACNNAASMAFGSWPAPSPTFRAIIWTITRASMTISRRSSGSSPSFAARREPP